MSRAGALSHRGDYYQILIATDWLIQLLRDTDIEAVQIESLGVPAAHDLVFVDDVVVCYHDGRFRFIQAKKNQGEFRAWSMADLRLELNKARDQFLRSPTAVLEFCSRTAFGDVARLAEAASLYPAYESFHLQEPPTVQGLLQSLAEATSLSPQRAFEFARHLRFTTTRDFDAFDSRHLADLSQICPRPPVALAAIRDLIVRHQAKLPGTHITIRREEVVAQLARHGVAPTPLRSDAEIMSNLRSASRIGRQWARGIGGHRIPTPHQQELYEYMAGDTRTILVEGRPGVGKTCLLLELADKIEADDQLSLLFVKADLFRDMQSEEALTAAGLPDDIVGQCARLSERRRVAVVVDSLDVLSLSRHHKALRIFLRLLDRLQHLDNVITVAACRDFDVRYDPLLRDRQWEKTIVVDVLDYASQVAPFLAQIGVHSSVPDQLRSLLCVPQYLKLFVGLAQRGHELAATSPYELLECFLRELVINDPALGVEAVESLQKFASDQLTERTTGFPRARFRDTDAVSALLSLEILVERVPGPAILRAPDLERYARRAYGISARCHSV